MHAKLTFAPLLALVLVALAAVSSIATVRAIQVDSDMEYSGEATRTVTLLNIRTDTVHWGVDVCPFDICEGRLAAGIVIQVPLNVKVEPGTQFVLDAPDGPVVEGDMFPVKVKMISKEGHFRMALDANILVRLGYNENEFGKIGCFGWEDPNPQPGDSCTEINLLSSLPELPIFDEGMTAAYAGGTNAFSDEKTLYSLKVCQLLIGIDVCEVRLIGIVGALLEATAGGPITDPGFHSDRGLLLGGYPMGETKHFQWTSPAEQLDEFKVTCGGSAGSPVAYQLTNNSYDSRLTKFTNGFRIEASVDLEVTSFDFTLYEDTEVVNWLEVFPGQHGPALHIFADAPDQQWTLGNYALKTSPPVIQMVTAPTGGDEGQSLDFSAFAVDKCPGISYRWDFSDGGVAFGPNTHHTFGDNTNHSFQLTVCDLRNNCARRDGLVAVANVAPVANAGPATTEAWGRPIAFNGQAVDPGAVDQSTLSYKWDFGDGTPSADALNVTHAYTTPGNYTATLTVCDKDLACDTDTRAISIRKRNTSVGYLGAHNWTYDTQVHLSASLVDEFGQMVNGRPIDFSIDGAFVSAASTNSAGIAERSHQVDQTAGAHPVGAEFDGDSLYESSTSASNSVVVVKATSVAYTGALTGGPNKTITLSAVLKDSEGKPLAGKLIDFQLGTQTAQATTDANGVATMSLKLSQKNGTYQLTSTYTPAGADVGKYAGSAASSTFKLQAK